MPNPRHVYEVEVRNQENQVIETGFVWADTRAKAREKATRNLAIIGFVPGRIIKVR